MFDPYQGLSNAEICERTYPFYNIEVGDMFVYDFGVYIRIEDKSLIHKEYRFEYNALSMAGHPVTFTNDTLVMLIDNPYIRKGDYYNDKNEETDKEID